MKRCNQKKIPTAKTEVGKNKLTTRYLYENIHKVPTVQKILNTKTYKTKEPPQTYHIGTISNTKLLAGLNRIYMAITSPKTYSVPTKRYE